MAWWRHSRVVQTMAVLLLLWTGTDLANPGLCALDREQEELLLATDEPTAAGVDTRTTAPAPLAPESPHVDDCFCCSHCVEATVIVTRLWSAPVSGRLDAPVLLEPRIFGLQLYHPPLV